MPFKILLVTFLLCLTAAGNEAIAAPKRILLLHSFGRDFSPWNEYSKLFRSSLDRRWSEPVDIYEASLVTARFDDGPVQAAFADYLRSLSGQPLDLIVSIGAPAASFLQKYRQQISPTVPILYTALEQRRAPSTVAARNDTSVSIKIDLVGIIENMLLVLPKTSEIVVVMGSSPNERFWTQQLRDAVQPLNSRVRFTWWNDLSFEEMLNLSASLPTGTAILFGLLSVDAAGVPLEQGDAVGRLHAVANAPIFSYVDAYFGRGIVGGPMISVADVSREAADVVERILRGTPPDAIKVPAIGFAPPKFDWRELQRWNIQDANLPAGSKVYFRVPSAFEQFRWYILSVVAFVLLQTAFIGALLLNRRRLERETTERKLAEEATRDLSGRLISAQEDERARLARELHDDVTQRLALLAIDAGQVERISGMSGHVGGIQKIRAGLVRLSEDVHALSYQLHPSVLDDLGLVEALKAECDRFARLESISVHARITDFNNDLSSNAALGIFRIAQEALRNIGRHAKASEVEVHLGVVDSNLQLKVCDNGAGFDSERPRGRRSLGLASMQQRTRVLGGELRVESAPGRGTTVWAEVPLQEKRSESPTAAAG